VTVLMPTDRVVFFVGEVSSIGGEEWKAKPSELATMIKAASRRLPVP